MQFAHSVAEFTVKMENETLSNFVWDNVTTTSSEVREVASYLTNIRDQVLKVVYVIIGILGVLDNLFVLVTFILFIKITAKVLTAFYVLCFM